MKLGFSLGMLAAWWFFPFLGGYPKELWGMQGVFPKLSLALFTVFCLVSAVNGGKARSYFAVPDTKQMGRSFAFAGLVGVGVFAFHIVIMGIVYSGYMAQFFEERALSYLLNFVFWLFWGWNVTGGLLSASNTEKEGA